MDFTLQKFGIHIGDTMSIRLIDVVNILNYNPVTNAEYSEEEIQTNYETQVNRFPPSKVNNKSLRITTVGNSIQYLGYGVPRSLENSKRDASKDALEEMNFTDIGEFNDNYDVLRTFMIIAGRYKEFCGGLLYGFLNSGIDLETTTPRYSPNIDMKSFVEIYRGDPTSFQLISRGFFKIIDTHRNSKPIIGIVELKYMYTYNESMFIEYTFIPESIIPPVPDAMHNLIQYVDTLLWDHISDITSPENICLPALKDALLDGIFLRMGITPYPTSFDTIDIIVTNNLKGFMKKVPYDLITYITALQEIFRVIRSNDCSNMPMLEEIRTDISIITNIHQILSIKEESSKINKFFIRENINISHEASLAYLRSLTTPSGLNKAVKSTNVTRNILNARISELEGSNSEELRQLRQNRVAITNSVKEESPYIASVEPHVKYFTLIMVRHGISCANIDKDLIRKQSSKDPDLTRWGLYHAMRLSIPFQEALHRDGYSGYPVGASVLMRAQQTAFFMTHTPDSYTFPGGMTDAPCRSIHIMPFASEVVTQDDLNLVREVGSSFQLDNQPQSIAEQSIAYNNLCSPFIVPCLKYDFVRSINKETNAIDYFSDAIVPSYKRMKQTLERLAKHAAFSEGMILFSHGKFIRHIYDTIKISTPTITTSTPKHIENCAATLFKFAIGLDGVFRPVSITPYDYTGTGTTVPKEEEKSEEHWRPDTCLTPRPRNGATINPLDKETRCRVFDQLRIRAMGGNSSSSSSISSSSSGSSGSSLPPSEKENKIISGYDSFLIDFAKSLTPPTSTPSSGLFGSLFGSASAAAAKDTLPECLSSIKGPLLRALLVRELMQPIPIPLKDAIGAIKAKFDPEDVKPRLKEIMEHTGPRESIYIGAMSRVIPKIYETPSCSKPIKDLATKYQSVYEQSLIYKATAPTAKARRRKSRRTNVRRRRQTRRRILG